MSIDLTQGIQQLANRAMKELALSYKTIVQEAEVLERALESFEHLSIAYAPLCTSLSTQIQSKDPNPWGFYYGVKTLPSIVQQGQTIQYPLIYSFLREGATALRLGTPAAEHLLNFALRAVTAYPLGQSCVYMLDADLSGRFNQLSPISTPLGEHENPKNFYHYIYTQRDVARLIDLLEEQVNSNITSYLSHSPSLWDYNQEHLDMAEPFHFVFINDITRILSDTEIERLQRLLYKGNARKAGVYLFFSYDEADLKPRNSTMGQTPLARLLAEAYDFSCDLPGVSYEAIVSRAEVDAVLMYIQGANVGSGVFDFKRELQQTLSQKDLWQALPKDYDYSYIDVPIGVDASKSIKGLCFSSKAAPCSPHFFIGGKSGSGKTILLHNIILNAAVRYSPDLLRFYLVDMKAGVSLLPYQNLPHAEVVSASSNRLYALTVLERAMREAEYRGGIFKKLGVTDISAANRSLVSTQQAPLPFILVVIDEFQELVKGSDAIAQQASKYIEQIHKKGRSQGVFIGLCTQSLGGVQTDISQVGVKLSLITNPSDSQKLIGNEGAAKLGARKGRAILNTSEMGEERYNETFQVAYIDEGKDLPRYIQAISKHYEAKGSTQLPSMLFNELDLSACITDVPRPKHVNKVGANEIIYLGMPLFCREEHASFTFHRDSKSHVAIVGNDRHTAMRLIGSIALQFTSAYERSTVLINDLQSRSSGTFGALDVLATCPQIQIVGEGHFEDALCKVHEELKHRRDNLQIVHQAPELLYVLSDLRLNPALRVRPSAFANPDASPTAQQQLQELLEQGPELGIHLLIYAHSMGNLQDVNDQIASRYVEIKIALRGGDSRRLIWGYGQGDAVEATGQALLMLPSEMGLSYPEGDLILPYNTLRDRQQLANGQAWSTLMHIQA